MKAPTRLLSSEDHWETRMGFAFPGDRVVYRGKDLFHDLKHLGWMRLYLFGITGRIFTDSQSKLFEGIWTLSASYPDPRLWNNRVGSLAGTSKSTGTLGLSAAIAVSEASIYGRRPDIRAVNFLIRARNDLDQGKKLQEIVEKELKKYRGIYGYGRPIVNRDERIVPLHNLAKELNLAGGTYTQIAFEVEKILLRGRWRMRMNVAALAAALAADQGLTEREYYFFLIPCFSAGIMPCFIEATERQEGTFFPIRCGRIHYEGTPRRSWGR
jgi:citrate synthase